MNKCNETFRINISKDVFDSYGTIQGHSQLKNVELGFKKSPNSVLNRKFLKQGRIRSYL